MDRYWKEVLLLSTYKGLEYLYDNEESGSLPIIHIGIMSGKCFNMSSLKQATFSPSFLRKKVFLLLYFARFYPKATWLS